jgi:hypothetical protein
MVNLVNFRFLICVIIFTSLTLVSASAQQSDNQRMKIEMTVRDGTNSIVSNLSNFSVSFSRPSTDTTVKAVANVDDYKPCYLVISFDRLDIPLLKVFTQTKGKLDGEIIVTDSYGKFPPRKIEVKSLVMDGMNDQLTGEYSAAYMNLSCKELVIDGVKLND